MKHAKIKSEITRQYGTSDDASMALDNAVHSVMSQKATEINNQGLDAQISFLLQSGLNEDEILAELEETT